MTIVEITQISAALAFVGGATYWGGQVKRAVDTLCNGQADHENRIRSLESGKKVPVEID
jgi:hypothetical protein